MPVQRRVMSWFRVAKSLQALLAHAFLFSFTLLLSLKLDRLVLCSWWTVIFPLWLSHAVVARGRFSLPAPSMPHGCQWAPCHSVIATPLLVAFELFLCIHLGGSYVVNLMIVFIPLIVLEMVILIDNIRMCRALMPGDEENLTDEAVWETLPHFWISISKVFYIAATVFTILKICGDVAARGWWDLFINYGIAQWFALLVCTKWHYTAIHGNCHITEPCSSSNGIRYLEWSRKGIIVATDEDRLCSLQDIGGLIRKIPFIGFQLLLFMHLEGTPSGAKNIPTWAIFSPLFLLQGAGVLFAAYRLIEKIVDIPRSYSYIASKSRDCFGFLHRRSRLLGWWLIEKIIDSYSYIASKSRDCFGFLHRGSRLLGWWLIEKIVDIPRSYSSIASKSCDCFGFLHRGSRLLGWWSIDEGSREEEARLFCAGSSGYNTFSPDTVKKMPRAELVEEIWRLQAALGEQTEVTKFGREEYERLQNEKTLCIICFVEQISVVLLPCKHHILCSTCCKKCKECPICRSTIEERMSVYDG